MHSCRTETERERSRPSAQSTTHTHTPLGGTEPSLGRFECDGPFSFFPPHRNVRNTSATIATMPTGKAKCSGAVVVAGASPANGMGWWNCVSTSLHRSFMMDVRTRTEQGPESRDSFVPERMGEESRGIAEVEKGIRAATESTSRCGRVRSSVRLICHGWCDHE